MQDRIPKIRNLLPNVPKLIKFGGIAHDIQQHGREQYFSSAAILFTVLVYFSLDPATGQRHVDLHVHGRVDSVLRRQLFIRRHQEDD